jgi:hypothetical protein
MNIKSIILSLVLFIVVLLAGLAAVLPGARADGPPRHPAPPPGAPPSIWAHSGSMVALLANGPYRQFVYDYPRPGMAEVGVRPGTLLFDGQRNGWTYAGTAFLFPPGCPAVPYPVSGPVSPDERVVTMYGPAPRVDWTCNIHGYFNDTLVFSLVGR